MFRRLLGFPGLRRLSTEADARAGAEDSRGYCMQTSQRVLLVPPLLTAATAPASPPSLLASSL